MILRSRRWRLLIRVTVLALASGLMLAFAAPASYALKDDTPKLITRANQLFDKEHPVEDSYIYTSALPDLTTIVTTHGINTTYHWMRLSEFGNTLIVRTEGPKFLSSYYRNMELSRAEYLKKATFYGKITLLKQQAGSDEVVKELALQGVYVDKDTTMVLLEGEEPSTYRPMVPVVGMLALFWILALVGLLRILSGRRPRRRRA